VENSILQLGQLSPKMQVQFGVRAFFRGFLANSLVTKR
jgi:hypothetical protein